MTLNKISRAKQTGIVTGTMLTAALLLSVACEVEAPGNEEAPQEWRYAQESVDASPFGNSSFPWNTPLDASFIPLPPSENNQPPCFDLNIGGGASCIESIVIDRFAHQACADRGARLESIGYDGACGGGRVSSAAARCCAPTSNWNPTHYDGGSCERQTRLVGTCESPDNFTGIAEQTCRAKGLFLAGVSATSACRNGYTNIDIDCCPQSPYPQGDAGWQSSDDAAVIPSDDAGGWFIDGSVGDASLGDAGLGDAGSDGKVCSVHAFEAASGTCATFAEVNGQAIHTCLELGRMVGNMVLSSTAACIGAVQSAKFSCCPK